MKKLFIILTMTVLSCSVFAEHIFSVCYINQGTKTVSYINDGISKNWKSRGELVGNGEIKAGETKCFNNIRDETLFRSHILTFYVNNKWFGIVNPPFSRPYIISQYATATKTGKLDDVTKDGHDNYKLYINIMPDESFVLSNSSDKSDSSQIIEPRKYST